MEPLFQIEPFSERQQELFCRDGQEILSSHLQWQIGTSGEELQGLSLRQLSQKIGDEEQAAALWSAIHEWESSECRYSREDLVRYFQNDPNIINFFNEAELQTLYHLAKRGAFQLSEEQRKAIGNQEMYLLHMRSKYHDFIYDRH